jgi:surface antigen
MYRSLLILLLCGMLSACTLSGKRSVGDSDLVPDTSDAALVFQSNENFASFLSSSDKSKVKESEEKTLNFGQPLQSNKWVGASGVSGTVVGYQLFRVGSEQCRRFKHSVTNSKSTETAEATACLGSDGKWRLVK